MSFTNDVSKLFTNKYFLYFIVFLASTNVLGYLVTNKLNAVVFFALVGLLSYQFSKNIAVVLLISLIATNFMMSNKIIREGMDTASTTDTTTSTTDTTPVVSALDNIDAKDHEISEKLQIVKNAPIDKVKTKL